MSANSDDLESCRSQETRSTATAPYEPPRTSPQQSYLSPSSGPFFEAYKFYRAGKEATWACAERTELYMKQEQLCNLTHSRAEEFEVEWQYQKLSPNQRAQVDRLVQDRRAECPGMMIPKQLPW
ncbi:hypothetical protein N7522_000184 [Penicillium canescens]|nr:hypothetical protein N7522_000184 [Penicillium canescens]